MTSRPAMDRTLLLANILDHFDGALYGFLVPLLAPLFFPKSDPLTQLIWGYSILGTGLITRPLGAFIFGIWARRDGPFVPLSYSILGTAGASLAFTFLPSHQAAGFFAPILLIAVRFIRGFFSAGESTISKLTLQDGKNDAAAAAASYAYPTSSMAGMVLASGVSAFLLNDYGHGWGENGFRVCFGISGIVGMAGYWYRLKIIQKQRINHETPPLFCAHGHLKTLWQGRSVILTVSLTTGLSHVTSILPFVVLNSLVPLISPISLAHMMGLNTALLVLDLILIPLLGRTLKNYPASWVMRGACIMLSVTFPIALGIIRPETSILTITAIRIWIIFWGVVFLCPQHRYYHHITAKTGTNRHLLVGMGNAIGAASIGRLSPVIMMMLFKYTGNMAAVGIYCAAVAAVSGYCIGRLDSFFSFRFKAI